MIKIVLSCIAGLLGILTLTWLIQGSDFFMYKFWAPKYENVRREVFENTKSYNQGMVQELQNMQFEYLSNKDENSKQALASIILHRVADFDDSKLPTDLKLFIQNLKTKQGEY